MNSIHEELIINGFAWLRNGLDPLLLSQLDAELSLNLTSVTTPDASILRSRGETYGSRNLLTLLPNLKSYLRRPAIEGAIRSVLGAQAAIVRVLYFDKPPGRSWSVPWHQDRTIAVQRNDLPSDQFRKPTTKAGMAHVEAPEWLLQQMLTLRIHVDPMTSENGPLVVSPGSHCQPARCEQLGTPLVCSSTVELHADAGDVLWMRPLLAHSSRMSSPQCTSHRRIVHLELAGCDELPDGYRWHTYERLLSANKE